MRHPEPEGEVLAHAHARVEGVGLEHHGDAAVLGLLPGDVPLADPDLAGLDLEQAGDGVEQRGLAAAGGAQQDQELAPLDLERQAVEDAHGLEGHRDVADGDGAHGGQPFTAPAAMPRTNQRPEMK